ncbi:hypothetical protein H0H87_000970 [Tephrocybe sp. NHM501043]|nr:hypothetical protein H0H87_000970 [Tephrocybe sp. NHM501043]
MVFIPEENLKAMEKYVEVQKFKLPARKKKKLPEEDPIKGSLWVPNSVLDGCKLGFTATDKYCSKANTEFFDNTALMALLCCYDIVVFIANMPSTGKTNTMSWS